MLFRILLAVACTSCAATVPATRPYPSSTTPQPPLSVSDTVTRLVLDTAIAGVPSAQQQPTILSGALTPRDLPQDRGRKFLLLSADDVQRFADDHGDVAYLVVYPVQATGDTASITITQRSAFRRPNHQGPVVLDGETIAEWLAVRRSERWIVVGIRSYYVLD